MSSKLLETLDKIIKIASDVIKYEKEAVVASKYMEEAGLRAQIARNNMINVKNKIF